jgi:NADPH:quinone reductase-like Zn-dependent oxidoreductase
MKQVVQNYRSGELSVIDVPVPACKPGGVLVRTSYSLISTGTEMMKVSEAKLSLLGKARQRPDQVRKVVDSVAQLGPVAAYQKAMTRLDSYTPLGYSLSGVVTEVGAKTPGFTVGDLVACAGNQHAVHAEVNWVPTNLCVPVPEGVEPRLAAFATVVTMPTAPVTNRSSPIRTASSSPRGVGLLPSALHSSTNIP